MADFYTGSYVLIGLFFFALFSILVFERFNSSRLEREMRAFLRGDPDRERTSGSKWGPFSRRNSQETQGSLGAETTDSINV